ncbi:MAG: response regulator, partial [Bacteroidetes bacterium]
DDGNIWLSSQQGISCLVFAADTFAIKNYDTFNGLQNNFFHDEAGFKTPSGQLLFGGVNGVSSFNPENIFLDTIPPKIVITDFKLFNRSVGIGEEFNGKVVLSNSINSTREVTLSHRENVVSFEFTGLHFGEPKKINYAYQLEGFDPDWVYTDASNRLAHYTNLPYDDFVFKVKAANGDGTWSDPVELFLVTKPPFWLTGWAYTFYVFLTIGMIYFGIRVTRMRAEFKHNLELERIDREKLEEVNWLKLQFFTNLSHEFRTPLTLIISPLEQLLQQRVDRKMNRMLSRMYYNANKLLTLINQFLDIRKNEAGLLNLHAAETDLVELGKEITLSFRYLAVQRNIELSFSSNPDLILVWVDHEQLEKVIFNLLSNALKFTKDGGKVKVHIEEKDQFVEITVSDSGIGIPHNELENIFERFYQVEKNQDRSRRGGTGIGLSLAKMIVEKHYGTIDVESTEGKGTNFTIRLLKGKSHFTEEELYPGQNADLETKEFVLPKPMLEARGISDEAEKPVVLAENDSTKPKILVVEDNPDVRDYLRENLEDHYKITEASDGQEGLEKALKDPPDLVLADIAMPRMDGIEMCSKIKSNIETCHVPVILLTARTSLVFKVDGLETGADDYVTKPFHMRLLEARIKNLIDSRSVLKQHFAKNFDLSPSGIVINSMDEKFLSQVKLIIDKHIDDSGFSVDQLASSLQMSRIQLYRKLKALTGKSPNKIIRSFRLKRAADLLKSGQYNVSDVTYLVGYNDLKSFRDQFKKEFGMSPSKYNK